MGTMANEEVIQEKVETPIVPDVNGGSTGNIVLTPDQFKELLDRTVIVRNEPPVVEEVQEIDRMATFRAIIGIKEKK